MCAKHRRDRKPIVSKLPTPSRHRSPTLSQTVRGCRCSPITVSRWSKICPIDRRRHDVGASVGEAGYPRSANCPRRRAIALPHSRRLCARQPVQPRITVSRWSKICPIDRPRQHGCKHRCDRIPKVGKLPAPSRHRSPTLSQTVRVSRHSPMFVSRWSKIGPIVFPRQLVCERRCDRIPKVGKPPAPSHRRADALPHSRRRRATAGSVPPPFPDGPKSVPSTARANMCASIGVTGYPRSANCPRRRAVALPHSRRLCASACAAPHHRFSMVESRSHRIPTCTCVQASV